MTELKVFKVVYTSTVYVCAKSDEDAINRANVLTNNMNDVRLNRVDAELVDSLAVNREDTR